LVDLRLFGCDGGRQKSFSFASALNLNNAVYFVSRHVIFLMMMLEKLER
jgi:hypothetical protein